MHCGRTGPDTKRAPLTTQFWHSGPPLQPQISMPVHDWRWLAKYDGSGCSITGVVPAEQGAEADGGDVRPAPAQAEEFVPVLQSAMLM